MKLLKKAGLRANGSSRSLGGLIPSFFRFPRPGHLLAARGATERVAPPRGLQSESRDVWRGLTASPEPGDHPPKTIVLREHRSKRPSTSGGHVAPRDSPAKRASAECPQLRGPVP